MSENSWDDAHPSYGSAFIHAQNTPDYFNPSHYSTYRDDGFGSHALGWYDSAPYPRGWPAAKTAGGAGLSCLPVEQQE
jgi:hypothetical protein